MTTKDRKYKYNVSDVINEFIILKKIIIKQNSKNCKCGYANQKGYTVRCLKCGYIHNVLEVKLIYGLKCGVCTNRICVKGINDVATTHPHMVKYFVSKHDANMYTYGSNVKVPLKCPKCGCEKILTVNRLTNNGFGCTKCSDGVSYPEKLVLNILEYLRVGYIRELNKSDVAWCGKYRYDFYLPDFNMIIETHGGQHYKDANGWRSLKYEKGNDLLKIKLAKENNVKNYIVLDCRKSELEWIKNSVMNSELPALLDFKEHDVDWIECDKLSMKSFMLEVCKIWEDRCFDDSAATIAKTLGMSTTTVLSYIKRGASLGICNYDPKEESKKGVVKSTKVEKKNSKRVICEGKIFPNISACANSYEVKIGTMSGWLRGSRGMPQRFKNMGLDYLLG